MHSFARHRHRPADDAAATATRGLILDQSWRYDLMAWFCDTLVFRGQWRALRQRTAHLARLQPAEAVLDVGCGTGMLAIEVARHVGRAGRVAGVDPGPQQIARARSKAARRNLQIAFQIGVIEQLPFSDQTFDVVFSTCTTFPIASSVRDSPKSPACSNPVGVWSSPISSTRRTAGAGRRVFMPGEAVWRI